ncbi:MAG: ATP-binding protein [Candidatus Saganbacteria bacterium]|nr:ATP-binding protein [Candidatus Saganbacteria bacterium]
MDINVIIRKGLIFSAITLVFSVLYMSIIYGSEYLLKPIVPFNIMWITLPAIFVLALFFQPISEKVQGFIERNIFRKQYLADRIAKKFSNGIKELMNIDDLATFITRAAVKVFKLKGSAIFVISEKDGKYLCLDSRGSFGRYKGSFFPAEAIIIAEMRSSKKAIVKEEIRLKMEQATGSEKGHYKRIMERFEELDSFILVPSISSKRGGEVVGFLIGGEKESGDMFSAEDISLLETFSSQASVSIENALMYQAQVDEIEQSIKKGRMSELGSTAAGVAHEAKNALNYINLFAQVLHLKKDDKEFLKSASQSFESETERMRILMEGVVDYSNPTAIEIKEESLKKIIDETVILVRDHAKGKNIAIEINVDENATIKVDRNSIKQVFLNLFLNALDAMQKDGKLAVKAETGAEQLFISISDTGCGIPEAKLQKIFEPFFTTKEQGTGLGLAIVKKAVEANRGQLSVESRVGAGTTFKLAFAL